MTALQKEIYSFYKAWVEWDQDLALEEAIEDFAAADEARRLSKAIILGEKEDVRRNAVTLKLAATLRAPRKSCRF